MRRLARWQLAGANHLFEFALQLDDLVLQHAPVGFDLRFTRTTHEAGTAALTLKVGPGTNQAALLVIQMGEVDLQRAFLGGGAATEDFEDQARAVNDLCAPFLFEIALLNRGQRMIDDHEACVEFIEQRLHFGDLARPHERGGARLADRDNQALNDGQIDGASKADRLLETRFIRAVRGWWCAVRRGLHLALLQDRYEHKRPHVIPALFVLRDDRFVFCIAAGDDLSPVRKRFLRSRTSSSAGPA